MLLVGVVPVLYVTLCGWLTVEQSLWAMSAYGVLDGNWFTPVMGTTPVAPLHPWILAIFLKIPGVASLALLSLPSVIYSLIVLLLTYRMGRSWFSPGVALLGCLFIGLNPAFVSAFQGGESDLCPLSWMLLGIYLFSRHLRHREDVFSIWVLWGGLALAATLLSGGLVAIWVPILCLISLFQTRTSKRQEFKEVIRSIGTSATAIGGLIVMSIGLGLAAPWLLNAGIDWGPFIPWPTPPTHEGLGLPAYSFTALMSTMPVALLLAVRGLWQTGRTMLHGEGDGPKAALAFLWAMVSFLAYHLQPRPATLLFLIIPWSLFASRTIFAIIGRTIPDRRIFGLLVASVCLALLASSQSAANVAKELIRHEPVSSADWLSLHLLIDLLVLIAVAAFATFRLTARFEQGRRLALGVIVVTMVLITIVPGWVAMEVRRRHPTTWSVLHQRLAEVGDVRTIILVGASTPSPPFAYSLRSHFPMIQPLHVMDRVALETAIRDLNDEPLVLVTDAAVRLEKSAPFTQGTRTLTLTQLFTTDHVVGYAPLRPTAK